MRSLSVLAAAVLVCAAPAHAAPVIANPSFESPVIPPNTDYPGFELIYQPADAGWTFTEETPGNSGSGISWGYRGFTPKPAPHGHQNAFLQGISHISQTIDGFEVGGTYQLSFAQMTRYDWLGWGRYHPNDLIVEMIDPQENVLTLYHDPLVEELNWQYVNTEAFLAQYPTYTLRFRTTDPGEVVDNSTLIDDVTIDEFIPEPTSCYWDGQADGNWDEINAITGNSRWADNGGAPFAAPPSNQSAIAVIRTNNVTLTRNASIHSLTAESGALALANNKTLTLKQGADFAAGTILALGTASHLTLTSGVGKLASITGGDVALIHGNISISGDLSMGAALGTLVVEGDVAMEATSTYTAELGGFANDLLAATKTVVLAEGSTLCLKAVSPLRNASGRLWGDMSRTILTAETISGTFTNSPALGDYLGAGVWLGDGNGRGISYVGSAPGVNEIHVAVFQAAPGDTWDETTNAAGADRKVDVPDIQQILRMNKFNKGEAAVWTDGDFSNDALVTADDIQLLLAANLFKKGPYAAGTDEPTEAAEAPNVVLNVTPEGLLIDTKGTVINGYVLTSKSGLLTGGPADNLGVFRVDSDAEISGQMFFALAGQHLLGDVVGEGVSVDELAGDLSLSYTLVGQAGTYRATLVVPEPATIVLVLTAAVAALPLWWFSARRRAQPPRGREVLSQ